MLKAKALNPKHRDTFYQKSTNHFQNEPNVMLIFGIRVQILFYTITIDFSRVDIIYCNSNQTKRLHTNFYYTIGFGNNP